MHNYYERRIGEEGEDDTHAMTREDRINFNYVPLGEVVRVVCSIYESNFKTSDDQYSFSNLVKRLLRYSSKFTVSKQKFDLGYADINFNCLTKKLFPLWKQIASKWDSEDERQN